MTSPKPVFNECATSNLVKEPSGYWRVSPLPSAEELQNYYAKAYFQKEAGSYSLTYSDTELENIRAKAAMRWAALPNKNKVGGRFLDVGCGEGFILAHAIKMGWQAQGLDFSKAGLEAQNPGCLDNFHMGDIFNLLDEEIENSDHYDVIWLQNVLEHVIAPEELMTCLLQLLSPEGTLVVTVPNDFSVLQGEALERGFIEKAFWVAPPDHLSYFTAESLRSLGQVTGWNCNTLVGDFPIDWLLFHQNANYVVDRSLGPSAQKFRLAVENLILSQGDDKAFRFFEGLADVGMGRNITAYFQSMHTSVK